MISLKCMQLLLSVSLFFSCNGRVVITGDADAPAGKSFSFDVSQSAGDTGLFYTARFSSTDNISPDSIRQFSVAGCSILNSTFSPLAPTLVNLNGVADQANPLIGQKIAAMGLYRTTPVVVCNDTPSNLYWISSGLGSTPVVVTSITGIKDAQGIQNVDGSVTAGVLKIAASNNYIFNIVKKTGGNFGDIGSGVALLQAGYTGIIQCAALLNDTGIKAVPLDPTLNFLTIGTTPTFDHTILDMVWDEVLQRGYIVFQSTGNGAGTDGAIGIAMVYLAGTQVLNEIGKYIIIPKVIIAPFVQGALFTGTNTILGGVGAGTVACLRKVRVMHTTTGPSYLVVVGNASNTNNQKTVYALPIVDKRLVNLRSTVWTDPSHGVLASKVINSGTNLTTLYDTNVTPSRIVRRAFQVAPTVPSHLPIETDASAQVGGGVTIGNIQDIQVFKDTVFVSTVTGTADFAGIFYSQALLDNNGAIKAWTPWQQVINATDSTTGFFGISFDSNQGTMFALQGSSSSTIDTVISSTWGAGATDNLLGGLTTDETVGFNDQLQQTFSATEGIYGLFDFPKNSVGFTTTVGSRTSLMLATGYEKIVLVETGQDNGANYFAPRIGNFVGSDNKIFTTGTISSAPTSNTYMITMSGGALANLGAITSATLVKETTYSYGTYLVIGGTGGLAVLRAEDGTGWTSLQKSFNGINNFSWVQLGSYTNIRKLTSDGQNLYVLTNKKLDRIPTAQLQGSTVTPVPLATPTSLALPQFGSFSDCVVSGDLALLATSMGLYTTGAGGVISTATGTESALWNKISVAEGPTAITRLVPFSTTGFSYDIAKDTIGGQIDVLASSVGYKLSSVYRFSIADATGGVTSTTVQRIPDGLLLGIISPYVHIGEYRNYYITDGAVPFITRSAYGNNLALLQALPSDLGFAEPFTGMIARHIQSIPFQTTPTRIAGIVRNSALGSLIVVTNDGLQILE